MLLRLLVLAALVGTAARGTTYYVDGQHGADANSGTTEATPWQSLGPVNRTVFGPGDVIYFHAGGRWDGTLAPHGSGAPRRPICIDVYGGTAPATIHGPGTANSAGLVLTDQSYWEIRHLEVTNHQPSGGQNRLTGIAVRNRHSTMQRHITIEQCVVHDVNSPAVTKATYDTAKTTGGIIFQGNLSEVQVTRCHIHDVATEGLRTNGSPAITDVVFTDNRIEDVDGDGIVIHGSASGSRIARNVVRNVCRSDGGNFAGVWTYASRGTLVEYNEVYGLSAGGPQDGEAFDADMDTDGDVFQYNYSHDNARGFMLFMAAARNIVVRYNISENDALGVSPLRGGHRLIAQNGGKGSASNQVYNNVFCSRTPLDTVFNTAGALTFRNNIVFLAGGTRQFNTQPFSTAAQFDHNCYFPASIVALHGPPHDATDILADPRLTAPGAGGTGMALRPDGFPAGQQCYRLRTDSPLRGAGGSLASPELRDYWGTRVGPRPAMGVEAAATHD